MKIYKGYQFKRAVAELITKTAKAINPDTGKNVSINWCGYTTTANINDRLEINLCDVSDDATLNKRDLARYVGYGVHELLHRQYTDFTVGRAGAWGWPEYLHHLHNGVEDAWIEQRGIDNHLTGNIREVLSDLLDIIVTESLDAVSDWSDPRQYPFVLAVYLRDHATKKIPLATGLEPIFAEAKRRLASAQNSADTFEIAKWVADQLGKINERPQKDKRKQGDGGNGDNNKGDGDANGNPVGNAKPVKDLSSQSSINPEPKLAQKEGDDYKGASGTYNEKTDVVKGENHRTIGLWLGEQNIVPAKLRFSVRKLFENTGREDWQLNRSTGTINASALINTGFSDKVFKRRNEVAGIDSAVAILVDVSGSMASDGGYSSEYPGKGARLVTAAQSALALLETLHKAGVATCVMTFASRVGVQKAFTDSLKVGQTNLRSLDDGGATNDYFAIRYAHNLLLSRREQRKVCFVLTDGEGNVSDCINQIAAGNNLGITTVGVGIQLDVSHIYKESIHVEDLDSLARASFEKIKLVA